jgi:chloramphenicol 3-O phosphotransferase
LPAALGPSTTTIIAAQHGRMRSTGRIVILNGAPRSGKTSVARAIQDLAAEPWLNLGVDAVMGATPARWLPGIGLRPGGERPDLEPLTEALYLALYDSVAAHARRGIVVVVDAGHHDAYSMPRRILPRVAAGLAGFGVLVVGVRCPIDEIVRRRAAAAPGAYVADAGAAARWDAAVHDPGIYDLEVDTSALSPEEAAAAILGRLDDGLATTAVDRLTAIGL